MPGVNIKAKGGVSLIQPWKQSGWLHVKWFVDDHGLRPESVTQFLTPHFALWLGVTLLGIVCAVIVNERLEKIRWVSRFISGLTRLRRWQAPILRLGLGIGLLFQLCTGTYLAPNFGPAPLWVETMLGIAIAGLIHRRLLPISGAALTIVYAKAIMEYGWFHALDYMYYVGIMYWLLASAGKRTSSAMTVLFVFTGLSLAWLAMEKLTIPGLADWVMLEYRMPTFGFSVEEFVLISAFIELALGWAFIAGILNRFTAAVLTCIFLLTTAVFGWKELAGHTVLHALFLVFFIGGQASPALLTERLPSPWLRCLAAAASFLLLLTVLIVAYIALGG